MSHFLYHNIQPAALLCNRLQQRGVTLCKHNQSPSAITIGLKLGPAFLGNVLEFNVLGGRLTIVVIEPCSESQEIVGRLRQVHLKYASCQFRVKFPMCKWTRCDSVEFPRPRNVCGFAKGHNVLTRTVTTEWSQHKGWGWLGGDLVGHNDSRAVEQSRQIQLELLLQIGKGDPGRRPGSAGGVQHVHQHLDRPDTPTPPRHP